MAVTVLILEVGFVVVVMVVILLKDEKISPKMWM